MELVVMGLKIKKKGTKDELQTVFFCELLVDESGKSRFVKKAF